MKFNKEFALYFILGYFALGEAMIGIVTGSPYKIFHVSVGLLFGIIFGFLIGVRE